MTWNDTIGDTPNVVALDISNNILENNLNNKVNKYNQYILSFFNNYIKLKCSVFAGEIILNLLF